MRVSVLQIEDAAFEVIWSFPHILFDGRSFPKLLRELFELYEACRSGDQLELPAPRPYRDHVRWLEQSDFSRARVFWKQRLAGIQGPHSPPCGDRRRRAVRRRAGPRQSGDPAPDRAHLVAAGNRSGAGRDAQHSGAGRVGNRDRSFRGRAGRRLRWDSCVSTQLDRRSRGDGRGAHQHAAGADRRGSGSAPGSLAHPAAPGRPRGARARAHAVRRYSSGKRDSRGGGAVRDPRGFRQLPAEYPHAGAGRGLAEPGVLAARADELPAHALRQRRAGAAAQAGLRPGSHRRRRGGAGSGGSRQRAEGHACQHR